MSQTMILSSAAMISLSINIQSNSFNVLPHPVDYIYVAACQPGISAINPTFLPNWLALLITIGQKSAYPLRTPRTRLSMKNEPMIISGTKYIHGNVLPI